MNQRLGRGLASLIGDAADEGNATPTDRDIRRIRTNELEPGPFQPRGSVDPVRLQELVESIRTQGVLQPLLVRPHPDHRDRFQIIAGERRWRAATEAGLVEVPALVLNLDDREAMAAALVENLQREDLNPLEEAAGYARLVSEYGMTQERLAAAIGKSRSHIANTIRLLNLPPPVQSALRSGVISAGHARALLANADPTRALGTVIDRGLNVRQTEALSNTDQRPRGDEQRDVHPALRKDPDTEALERDLALHLGLKIDIRFDGRRGTLRIHYTSLDQLDGLVTLLRQ